MSNDVWVSRIMCDTTLTKNFIPDIYEKDKQLALKTMRDHCLGIAHPPEHFPKQMWPEYSNDKKKQPDIFLGGGYWVVSEALAELLKQFNLGQTALYPVELFQFDRKTPVEGSYACLAFGEQKRAFLPHESERVRKAPYISYESWLLPGAPKNGEIAVEANALKGVDLWIDPLMRDAVFFSGALVDALRHSKLTRRLGLSKCRLVSDL